MSDIKVVRFEDRYFDHWNRFVEESSNGTLFHRLDFLDYHGDEFREAIHNIIWLKGESIVAVMPMLVKELNGKRHATSPFGASFGGIVTGAKLPLRSSESIATALLEYFASNDISSCEITYADSYVHEAPNAHLEFSLFRRDFSIVKAEVFSVIQLPLDHETARRKYEGRARTSLKKACPHFKIQHRADMTQFYEILQEDKLRHNSEPTHTLPQLLDLQTRFPASIWCDIATHDHGGRAGVLYVSLNGQAIMTFYMAQETVVLSLDGTNVLVDLGIQNAIEMGYKYFDFGGSTLGYEIENIGVSNFKESFGACGYLRKTIKWDA